MTKIISFAWFNPLTHLIGICIVDNGHEEKAYIGTVIWPSDEITDIVQVAKLGAKFPLEAARLVIAEKGKEMHISIP